MTLPFSKPPLCRDDADTLPRIKLARGGHPMVDLSPEAIDAYRAGDTLRVLCERFKVSKGALLRALKRNGVFFYGGFRSNRSKFSKNPSKSRFYRESVAPVLKEMRQRVRQCLNKKPPKLSAPRKFSAVRGMSPAERVRHYYHTNTKTRENCRIRNARWRQENQDKIRGYRAKYQNRIRSAVYLRMRKWLKLHKEHWIEAVGCTKEQLFIHLENQFEFGMTWNNYGLKGWHIDHKKPLAAFNMQKPEQAKAASHYTNLRPCWASVNIAKGSKYRGKRHFHKTTAAPSTPPPV
jgi:hypothetical protein